MVITAPFHKLDLGKIPEADRRMLAAIPFPAIDPEIFTLTLGGFSFSLRWYAMAYIVGLLLAWRIAVLAMKRDAIWPNGRAPMAPAQVEDLLFWVIIGVIIGGRLGYVLAYDGGNYLQNPIEILKVWEGGMAFHGGFLGVVAGAGFFAWRHKIPMLSLADAMAIATPPGLMLGRLANFINAELWGRPTDVPWGVEFPGLHAQDCGIIIQQAGAACARHPSQIYEALLEGLLLGAVLLYLAFRRGIFKRPGMALGIFIAGYGAARFTVEFFRQADDQFRSFDNPWGHVIRINSEFGFTMGQVLSLPMIVFGVGFLVYALKTRIPQNTPES